MKLASVGLAIASIKTAQAGFALIEEAITEGLRNLTVQDMRPGLRKFNPLTTTSISNIRDGFGCWCYFDDDSYQGRGNPLNDVDAMCKVLQQGYECFEMDDGGSCIDPWDVPYARPDLTTIVNEDYKTACEAINSGNNCATRACIIESRFSDHFLKTFNNGWQPEATLLHSDASWDMHASCPIKVSANTGVQHKECCGEYPLRFPYKKEGDRACCAGTTYDSGIFRCCNGETIEMVCEP